MNLNKVICILACSLVAAAPIKAIGLEAPVLSEGDFHFYLDTASFYFSNDRTLQEFYYQVPLPQLNFDKIGPEFSDTLSLHTTLFDSVDHVIFADTSIVPVVAKDLTSVLDRYLPDKFELLLSPASYRISLEMIEDKSGRKGWVSTLFQARPFNSDSLKISDLQFSSSIRADTTESKFLKNGFKVLPNPSRGFGFSLPMLFFYCEIYNLFVPSPSDTAQNKYQISYDIRNALGDIVKSFPAKLKVKPGTSSVEIGAINVGALSDTLYSLAITVIDVDTKQKSQISRRFRTVPLNMPEGQKNEVEIAIGKMSAEEVAKHLRYLRYILTPNESKMFSELSGERLRTTIINYWMSKDPSPDTPKNEFWNEFMGRIELANKQFSSSFTEGWNSDRGRILIRFGVPDEINRHPMSIHSVPYIEWLYYREEGMKFIFADEDGFNRYRLIYSSDERELTDPNWTRIIDVYQR